MWTRDVLKSRAKEVLKGNYWKSFLISLVIILSGADGSGGRSANNDTVKSTIKDTLYYIDYNSIMISAIGIALLFIAFRILLGYSLEVGSRKYFVQSAQYKEDKGYFSFAFDRQNYTNLIKTMFLKGLYTLLWTLLLIIPGVIKSYEYRMIPYILGDNPNLGDKRVFELSNLMTDGHKMDMFILDLSFIGWLFLGALALGVGVLFVNPYVNATEAELYLVLRNIAIENGYCTYDELVRDNNYL